MFAAVIFTGDEPLDIDEMYVDDDQRSMPDQAVSQRRITSGPPVVVPTPRVP